MMSDEFANTNMESLPKACLNCENSLPEGAKYCYKCGQKVTDGRITLKELFAEFLESVFNFDTKFFQTLVSLFIPGKLTVEYFSGKHKSFLQPIRLFLVVTVLLIAALSFVLRDQDANLNSISYKWEEEQHIHNILLSADTLRVATVEQFNNAIATEAIDTFYQKILKYDQNYTDTVKMPIAFFGEVSKYARQDILQLSENDLIEKYIPDASFFTKLTRKQEVKFMKSNQDIIDYGLSRITWLVLIMLPMFAFSLKLLYIRRPFYYVEHLIFSFHVHTFFFIWLLLITIFDAIIPEVIQAVSLLILPVYILFAMRKFYQQKWWKTFVKFFIAHFAYWTILAIGVMITGLVSFLLF